MDKENTSCNHSIKIVSKDVGSLYVRPVALASLVILSAFFMLFILRSDAIAQEGSVSPLLSVKELSDQGMHLDAVLSLHKEEGSHSLGEILAAARSAWALGLVAEARARWDEALGHPDCSGLERARALYSRSIMEIQEHKYEDARMFAEEGTSLIGPSDLRGQLNFLIGESLFSQGLFSVSESYYEKAVLESGKEGRQEALLKLATVQERLGKSFDARKTLVKVELSSNVTPIALKRLIDIDAGAGNNSGVRTWITEGRNAFPSEFHSSRLVYSNARAMLHDGMVEEAEEEIARLSKEARDSDPWLQLGRAILEEYYATQLLPTISTERQ
jgi:tetratricopeptide (TPR) repeat protein